MKTCSIVALLGVSLLLVVNGLTAAESASGEKKFQATCPVSGQPAIEKSVVALPKGGGNVYFCCENCPKAFKSDPEKFTNKVRRQLLETGQVVQVACPVSGQPVDKEVMVEVGHAKVGFCCKNCLAKFEKADDDGKLAVVFDDLDKGFTRQVKCPISGKPINPEAVVEHDGKQVYFCCPGCPAAFEANPEKFLDKLPQFAKADGEASK